MVVGFFVFFCKGETAFPYCLAEHKKRITKNKYNSQDRFYSLPHTPCSLHSFILWLGGTVQCDRIPKACRSALHNQQAENQQEFGGEEKQGEDEDGGRDDGGKAM